jgi:hypothetical protein
LILVFRLACGKFRDRGPPVQDLDLFFSLSLWERARERAYCRKIPIPSVPLSLWERG